MTDLPLHGGDLAAAGARWGVPAEGWLDLSTGINPWPYPVPDIPSDCWRRLPDGAAMDALCQTARRRWSVPAEAEVVAGAGSQALIQALPRITPATDVAILGPTYGEHARAWSAAGHAVHDVTSLDQAAGARMVVVVNPNNPDGRAVSPAALLALAKRLALQGGWVVVDEAFGDERPECALTSAVMPGLVVLRSFGKFFGLAGLRLGFAIAPAALAAHLAAHLGPWPVSGPALAVGARALADESWTAATISRLSRAASRLDAILSGAGVQVLGGTFLFRLARHEHAAALYEHLGRTGILVRAFAHRGDILRFGLPGSEAEEQRLRQALEDWCGRTKAGPA